MTIRIKKHIITMNAQAAHEKIKQVLRDLGPFPTKVTGGLGDYPPTITVTNITEEALLTIDQSDAVTCIRGI